MSETTILAEESRNVLRAGIRKPWEGAFAYILLRYKCKKNVKSKKMTKGI